MSIELLLFILNMIVAVNAHEIEGTMLGTIGLLLGGIAGIVSAATTAFALAADPLRGITKSQIEHDLALEKSVQTRSQSLLEEAMNSPLVKDRAERNAARFIDERFDRVFQRRLSDDTIHQNGNSPKE